MAAAEDLVRRIAYEPRGQFRAFHNRDNRWAVIVAHRRAGKTVACVMELLTRALATSKTNARYAYIAPFYSQAKLAAWDYLKQYAQPVAEKFSESELSVELKNGSKVRLFGADNPDALRGMYLDGVVLDEFADMRTSVWGEIIRPLLADRKGWAVFIGTPKGKNEFFKLQDKAESNPEWFHLVLRASETELLPAVELADAAKSMTESQYAQEFECSFDAAITGAIFAKEVARAREQKRIRSVPYEPINLVSTAWDLGRGDPTAIWFFQWVGTELRVIDFYQNHGEPITHYMGVLKGRGYQYDTHFLPHDAQHKQLVSEKSVQEIMRTNGFNVRITPKLSLEEGINAGRLALGRALIDDVKCSEGIDALVHYQWDYNTKLEESKHLPLHNWASHPADAWRYFGIVSDQAKPDQGWGKKIKYDSRGIV